MSRWYAPGEDPESRLKVLEDNLRSFHHWVDVILAKLAALEEVWSPKKPE